MPFDSEIGFTSCPNYNSETGLIQSFHYWEDSATNHDPSKGLKDFNQICFNVCPTKDEEREGAPDQAYYVENLHCKKCPNPRDQTGQGEENYRDPPLPGTVQDLKNKRIYGMCSNNLYPEPEIDMDGHMTPDWWTRQQDANISQIYVNKVDWRTQDSQLWKNADRGMTDTELLHALGKRRPGTLEYVLPPEYMNDNNTPNYNKLREDINDGRGSIVECVDEGEGAVDWLDHSDVCARKDATVAEDGTISCPDTCVPINGNSIHSKCKSPDVDLGKCYNTSNGTYVGGDKFGPNHIIPEEAYDFWENLYGTFELPDTSSDGMGSVATFAELLKGIGADSTFEACVNDVLNTGHNDLEIQENISKYESIKEFKSEDINYLKRKLRKNQPAKVLSGGERRLLEISRALVMRPSILLVDEPSIGLEPRYIDMVFEILDDLQKNEKKTIIMVEQNAKKGLEFADIGYVLVSGQTAIVGKGNDLLKNSDVGRLFLGG